MILYVHAIMDCYEATLGLWPSLRQDKSIHIERYLNAWHELEGSETHFAHNERCVGIKGKDIQVSKVTFPLWKLGLLKSPNFIKCGFTN